MDRAPEFESDGWGFESSTAGPMKEQTMNIKPSGQQVEKWIAEASSEGGDS